MDSLIRYSWPGNVRQLRNCIESLILLCGSDVIGTNDLPMEMRLPERTQQNLFLPEIRCLAGNDELSIKAHIKQIERVLIGEALWRTKNNHTHAAEILQISHRALLYKIKEYKLQDN